MSWDAALTPNSDRDAAIAAIEALGPADQDEPAETTEIVEVDESSTEDVSSDQDTAEPQEGEEYLEDGPPAEEPEHPTPEPLEPDGGFLGGKYKTREEFEGAYKELQAAFTRNQQSLREQQELIHQWQQQQLLSAGLDQLPEDQQQALYAEAEARGMDPHTLLYLKQQEVRQAEQAQRGAAVADIQKLLSSHPMAQDPELVQAIEADASTVLEIYNLPANRIAPRMAEWVAGKAAQIKLARMEAELPKMQAAWKKQGAEEAVKRQSTKRQARGEIGSGGSASTSAGEPRSRSIADELTAARDARRGALPWRSGFR